MQQINLYLPQFHQRKEWATLRALVAVTVALVVVLAVSYFYLDNKQSQLEKTIIAMEDTVLISRERVDKYGNRSLYGGAIHLDQQLSMLRKAVAKRKEIQLIIEDQDLGNRRGFADSMQALARQSNRAIALTRFRLSDGGQRLDLLGVCQNPQQVPVYLHALRSEDVFHSVNFGLLSLRERKQHPGQHDFSVGFDNLFSLADTKQGGAP